MSKNSLADSLKLQKRLSDIEEHEKLLAEHPELKDTGINVLFQDTKESIRKLEFALDELDNHILQQKIEEPAANTSVDKEQIAMILAASKLKAEEAWQESKHEIIPHEEHYEWGVLGYIKNYFKQAAVNELKTIEGFLVHSLVGSFLSCFQFAQGETQKIIENTLTSLINATTRKIISWEKQQFDAYSHSAEDFLIESISKLTGVQLHENHEAILNQSVDTSHIKRQLQDASLNSANDLGLTIVSSYDIIVSSDESDNQIEVDPLGREIVYI